MVTAVIFSLFVLAAIIFVVWAIITFLRCLTRIAIALEKSSGIESPRTPDMLVSR